MRGVGLVCKTCSFFHAWKKSFRINELKEIMRMYIQPSQMKFLMWINVHKNRELSCDQRKRLTSVIETGVYLEMGQRSKGLNKLREDYLEEYLSYR